MIIKNTTLKNFLESHPCCPAPPRPNTTVQFQIADTSQPPLINSPSPLYRPAWAALLEAYPGDLPTAIDNILRFGALIGYSGSDKYIVSKNLKSTSLNPTVLTEKVSSDINLRRIREVQPKPPGPFISSPLGLVPKPGNKWRTIHHLSYPPRESVNDSIDEEAAYFKYVSFERILSMVLKAGRNCTMLKRDMKDAFRMIPIAPQHHWLMGFSWDGKFYVEQVLSFSLRTAPIIFNLFAEAWEWIVRSYLRWHLIEHYLDDMMAAFPASQGKQLTKFKRGYPELCDITGILRNDDKDAEGTTIKFLGRIVDSTTFTVYIPQDKVDRVISLTADALVSNSMTIHEAQQLAGLLSFCASAVQLGFVFCRRIWSFVASFRSEWNKEFKRRIPAPVREDVQWWHDLFPAFNGVRFFDDSNRGIIHLFADASAQGMGAFYFDNVNSPTCDWKEHACHLPPEQALALPLPHCDPHEPFNINIFEITALLRAFEVWSQQWKGKLVVIHTDSSTAQLGLIKLTLKAESQNEPLRRLLLLAAQLDIKIEPQHLPGEENGLADALSREIQDHIADWCPHWQKSYHSLSRQ